jgi:hypothetical protein
MSHDVQWKEVLYMWKNGLYPVYPKSIKNRFMYETSMCNRDLTNIYYEKFIETEQLEHIMSQNYGSFIEHIAMSLNKHVTSFYNKSKDTLLIIPIPKKNKNFSTIKDFMDNASKKQQQYFWNRVSKEILLFLTKNENVFISTHGLGVHYFHIRLCKYPKYYKTTKFIKQYENNKN